VKVKDEVKIEFDIYTKPSSIVTESPAGRAQ